MDEVFINQEVDPYVLEADGTFDVAALQLQPATVVINGLKGLVDVHTSKTKRTFLEIQEKVLRDATAGSKANPLCISGAPLSDPDLTARIADLEKQQQLDGGLARKLYDTVFRYSESKISKSTNRKLKGRLKKTYGNTVQDIDNVALSFPLGCAVGPYKRVLCYQAHLAKKQAAKRGWIQINFDDYWSEDEPYVAKVQHWLSKQAANAYDE